jgi:hypothetical protein
MAGTKKRILGADELREFMTELLNESDRVAVIIGGARLDLALEQLLVSFLAPSPKDDDLFEVDRPLGSFGAKIDLAHRLRLIPTVWARSLHLIRKLRNAFAHEVHATTLSQGAHQNRVRELVAPFHKAAWMDELREGGEHRQLSAVSFDFRLVVSFLAMNLSTQASAIEPAGDQTKTMEDAIANAWGKRERA